MPSLEIICIDQAKPLEFANLSFDVEAGTELVSHRSPSPLFQPDFDGLNGCIYHLLEPGGITVYELLKQDWFTEEGDSNGLEKNLEFRSEFASDLLFLLKKLLAASPAGRVLFTSDYQFGPEEAKRFEPITIESFWRLHNEGKIRMNASYPIVTV